MARRSQYCSFCGKKQEDVRHLLGSPSLSAFTCNECVEKFVAVLASYGCEPFCHTGAKVIAFSARRDITKT